MRKSKMCADQDAGECLPAEIDTPHWLRMTDDAVVSFELFFAEDGSPPALVETVVPPEFLNIL